jgi:hypothetical protein
MNASEIAEAYIEAYEAGRASTKTRRSMLFRVIEGIACVTMAAAVALSLALIAQLMGVYPG